MDIKRIINEISNGNIVITPTDTVYGLLCKAMDISVVKKVYEAKKRSSNKSFIVLVSNDKMLESIVDNITDIHRDLMNRYWPGKLTIIFDKKDIVSDLVTGGLKTVAVRYPNNKELIEIINGINEPLISTSANISNHDTITDVKMIDKELRDKVSYIYDGGVINSSSSTIVSVIGNSVKILRDGELGIDIRKHYKVID